MKAMILCFLFLTATSVFAYDVVLKNGKILAGEIVKETETLIILQDSSGVQLQLKKSQIDSTKTEERNRKSETEVTPVAPENSEPTAVPEKKPEETPKSKGRVYKKEDLDKMPELSIVGSEENHHSTSTTTEPEVSPTDESELEAYWNEEALRIGDDLQQAKEAYEYNKSFCDKVIPDLTDLRDGPYVKLTAEQYEENRRFACVDANAAEKDLHRAEVALEKLQEEARKKGIPPGWVDPDRIRQ